MNIFFSHSNSDFVFKSYIENSGKYSERGPDRKSVFGEFQVFHRLIQEENDHLMSTSKVSIVRNCLKD